MAKDDTCSYCGKPLGKSYSFSYGIPGLARTFACQRLYCKATRAMIVRLKKYLKPTIQKLNHWVNN